MLKANMLVLAVFAFLVQLWCLCCPAGIGLCHVAHLLQGVVDI